MQIWPRYPPKCGGAETFVVLRVASLSGDKALARKRARDHQLGEAGKVDARLLGKGKLPWRETGPLNHHDDKVDSDQQVVNKELSLSR